MGHKSLKNTVTPVSAKDQAALEAYKKAVGMPAEMDDPTLDPYVKFLWGQDVSNKGGAAAYPRDYWEGYYASIYPLDGDDASNRANVDTFTTEWLASPAGKKWKGQETVAPAPSPAIPAAASIASEAAKRARRRASVGNAGRVSTGTPTALQQQIGATGAPRTLIGS